jgi:hypothetical protein
MSDVASTLVELMPRKMTVISYSNVVGRLGTSKVSNSSRAVPSVRTVHQLVMKRTVKRKLNSFNLGIVVVRRAIILVSSNV